jgi:hypothetical protein
MEPIYENEGTEGAARYLMHAVHRQLALLLWHIMKCNNTPQLQELPSLKQKHLLL